MSISAKLFGWMVKRSVKNAAHPNPPATPATVNVDDKFGGQQTPIEFAEERDLIIGTDISLGHQDSVGYGPDGSLVRRHRNMSILCGCGHIVSQLQPVQEEGKAPLPGVMGECFYCRLELNEWVQKGLISPFEAQRQSLICSNCAKITLSGKLCCPKHYTVTIDANGNTVYLGPEDQAKQQELAEQQARHETVQKILTPFRTLFLGSNPEGNNE